jgi:hypothetical protein
MSPLLQEALSLALQLNPKERLQLIEQVASSVEHELNTDYPPTPSEKHWGKNLLRLLDEIGPIELDHPEIEDPVEWVKTIRQEQAMKHDITWDTES